MTNYTTNDAETMRLLRTASEAGARGDMAGARGAYDRVLMRDPDNPIALNALGMQALQSDPARAADLFTRATAADPAAIPLWMNLATAHRNLRDDTAERAALEGALAIDQLHMMGNVRLAELLDRSGDSMAAAYRWSGVASMIQQMPDRSPALEDLLARALDRVASGNASLGQTIDGALDDVRSGTDPRGRRRFDACVDAMLGRRAIYANACHGLHFPFLPADEFFDRNMFPWLAELEAATPAIQRELEGLLATPDSGFAPYVAMAAGTPANKWSPLDHSDDWSARYLWRYGVRDDALCAQCPETAAIIERLPRADMPGRGPTAFFSVLKPGTHLPAHSGVSNVRAIVHLPLIVPDGCRFRVGGETRPWTIGEAFVFDDTIEHEAWNDSAERRAVLIFDVWNPHLSEAERDMLRTLFATLGSVEGTPAGMGAVVE